MSWKDNEQIPKSSLPKLAQFADLLLKWNSRINLTGYRKREEIEELLIGESVLAAYALKKAGKLMGTSRVLDFGSGAGIPGLIWVILDLPITLTSLEIRQKKVAFQKEVVRELDLQAKIVSGRFPEAVSEERFDLIVSRAIRFDRDVWREGKMCFTEKGIFVRFAPEESKDPGWERIPVSERTTLLVSSLS